MSYRRLFVFLYACSFMPLGIAQPDPLPIPANPSGEQEAAADRANPLYEPLVAPDRTLARRLDQAERLFEAGRDSEAAQLFGSILENANHVFLPPKEIEGEPTRTLHQTVNDYIIEQIRKLPKEARESYAFQFEPTAKRLLENAVAAGSLDDIQQIARKYYPTPSGAAAAFLVGFSQWERGDFAAAFLTLDKLNRLHPAIPDTLQPALTQLLEEWNKRQNAAGQPPQRISESAWLELIGWRIPSGAPSQSPNTRASAPLLEQNWTVPAFNRYLFERETDSLTRTIKGESELYIPAAQPLVVGDLFITRTIGETIAVDTHSGKRLWISAEPEYRFPENIHVQLRVSPFMQYPRPMLRYFFWHDRISHQLSSDGERLFGIDEHDMQGLYQTGPQGRFIPPLGGKGEDLRYSPGSTLTARDLKSGRILWQIGKFPYVQKYIDVLFAPGQKNDPQGQVTIDERIYTDDEKTFKETWFLGAPLPLHGKLYTIGETDGTLYLFTLESQTGKLLARQPFAQTTVSMSANFPRRTYPLFPSSSEGIVICPTGNGLIAALDATTLAPVWCYSYVAPPPTSPNEQRAAQMRFRQQTWMIGSNVNDNTAKQLFTMSGWQVPSIIIDRYRVLVAPPDRAVLFCLDLLTGKLLWEQTVPRPNALYVAGIHNDKAFLVTPGNIMTIDMNDGKDLTPPNSKFPETLKPAGVGVRSGNQYFIPFTDGQLAVADLESGKLTWLDVAGTAITPSAEPSEPENVETPQFSFASETPKSSTNEVLQQPIQFGNLVGIKGRFFSQSPTQISGFDQKEPLRQRTEALLQANANDPDGLRQQGRLLKSEGKLAEAIESLRASLKAKHNVETTAALRKSLLEALRKDYLTWAHASKELESLAEFPEEWGAILYAQIEGILQSGQTDDFTAVLEKVFALGLEPILIPVSNEHSAQLHRALGCLLEQHVTQGDPAFRARWEEIADAFLDKMVDEVIGTLPSTGGTASIGGLTSPALAFSAQVQRWTMFVNIFRNTPAAEKATHLLREEIVKSRLPLALDLMDHSPAAIEWSKLTPPVEWKVTGRMDIKEITSSSAANKSLPNLPLVQDNANQNEINNQVNRLLNRVNNPITPIRAGENYPTIPYLGSSDSVFSACTFFIKPGDMGIVLSCCNLSDKEKWRIPLPNSYAAAGNAGYGFGFQPYAYRNTGDFFQNYIKGVENFLVLVNGTTVTAIDATPQAEKVLWSKTFTSPLLCQQVSARMSSLAQRPTTGLPFPKHSVVVTPHVVCCLETNGIYGFDPLTGQTLWERRIASENCSLLGDDEHLFLVFPDRQHVVAVDPASGREIESGSLPPGGVFVYGTNIVSMLKSGGGNEFVLYICDLRDIHDHARRRLLAADLKEGSQTLPIPRELLHDKLTNVSMVQPFRNDRFLSAATWATKSLQIIDLQTKKKLFPDDNTILDFVPNENVNQPTRCEVELVGDRVLVLFTKDINYKNSGQAELDPENEKRMLRLQYRQLGIPGYNIGEALMMLFDSEGKPCWKEPTKIENTSRLADMPTCLPVMMFAVWCSETDTSTNQQRQSTRLMAVDKRTGEFRLRKRVYHDQIPLQTFRVSADLEAQELLFTTLNMPQRTVRAFFPATE